MRASDEEDDCNEDEDEIPSLSHNWEMSPFPLFDGRRFFVNLVTLLNVSRTKPVADTTGSAPYYPVTYESDVVARLGGGDCRVVGCCGAGCTSCWG